MPSLEWPEQLAALYVTHQPKLRRQLAAVVNTTPENLEDACMFAWMQLFTHRLDKADAAGGWLLTVARREAIKLDRRARRNHPLPTLEDGSALEAVDRVTTSPPSSSAPMRRPSSPRPASAPGGEASSLCRRPALATERSPS